jgi:predicted Rossmann-fold nucleotide-binding protein
MQLKSAKFWVKTGILFCKAGNDASLMGVTLHEFQRYSNDVEVIIPEIYKDDLKNLKYKKAHITKTLVERNATISKQSDMIIVLPGGTGTLYELLSFNETKRAKEHACEVNVINSDGFFNGLETQIETMKKFGFSNENHFTVKLVNNIDSFVKHL